MVKKVAILLQKRRKMVYYYMAKGHLNSSRRELTTNVYIPQIQDHMSLLSEDVLDT